MVKSPVRENRPPGSVRGAPGNRRPYRDPPTASILSLTPTAFKHWGGDGLVPSFVSTAFYGDEPSTRPLPAHFRSGYGRLV